MSSRNYDALPTTPPSTPILISTTYNLADTPILEIVTEESEAISSKEPLIHSQDTELDIGRDPTHIREEAVEEVGDEFIPHHEYYEGREDLPYKQQSQSPSTALVLADKSDPDAQALVTVPNTKYYTMAVVPGRGVRTFVDITSFIIALLLVILQFGVIDYYFISWKGDTYWYGWIGPDAVVILALFVTVILAIKYNRTQMEEVCSVDGKMKYAWVAWLIYSLVLVAKIATCFRIFHQDIPPTALQNNDKIFDDMLFKLTLSLSFVIFMFILEAHHYTPLRSPRQLYISYLATAICLDLVDNIYFLDLLWQAVKDPWVLPFWLELAILVVSCVNFVMPTFALFKLRFGRFPGYFLVSDKIWAFLYVLLVNAPVLGLRIYLYIFLEVERHGHKYDPSLFPLKNLLMIYIALRELWTRLQYWRLKRRATGSRGELTAHNPDEES
ncbi:hypothetical protein WR25_08995 isoform A [Diploscapter pachys]|uniref:Transmembrane protein n=1 Tax=Diploscapter pachys TaxID=2018661 RepID=A0A2A2M1G6_9BILA|nr:hypothetical protein WR25_08995 isoform A [Diploscapter pachys]